MTAKLRLAFMGTPDFAVYALHALKKAGHDIVAVYTQPPRPAGRGHKIQKSPVHQAAEELHIDVHTPKTLRDTEEQKKFAGLNLDIAVVAAYGLILPPAVLQTPKYGCVNIHASILPRWRGAAPIQRAILAGDRATGVTIMQMAEGLDTGDLLRTENIVITPQTTATSLHDELAQIGARLIVPTIEDLAADKIKPQPQPQEGVTYAAKLTREDGRIDWSKPATDIERQIRALQPWPGCFFMLGEEPVKLLAVDIIAEKSAPPGTLLDAQFTIACGKDALRLMQVQRAGKSATDGAALLRGLRLPVGQRL